MRDTTPHDPSELFPDEFTHVEFADGTEAFRFSDGAEAIRFQGANADLWHTFLAQSAAAFEAKFGRPPGPGDPVFWDEDADVPTPLSEEKIAQVIDASLAEADVSEAARFATARTGILLTTENEPLVSPQDREWWYGEADLYDFLTQPASQHHVALLFTEEISSVTAQATALSQQGDHGAAVQTLSELTTSYDMAILLRLSHALLNALPYLERHTPSAPFVARPLTRTRDGRAATETVTRIFGGTTSDVSLPLESTHQVLLFSLIRLTACRLALGNQLPLARSDGPDPDGAVYSAIYETFSLDWHLPLAS